MVLQSCQVFLPAKLNSIGIGRFCSHCDLVDCAAGGVPPIFSPAVNPCGKAGKQSGKAGKQSGKAGKQSDDAGADDSGDDSGDAGSDGQNAGAGA